MFWYDGIYWFYVHVPPAVYLFWFVLQERKTLAPGSPHPLEFRCHVQKWCAPDLPHSGWMCPCGRPFSSLDERVALRVLWLDAFNQHKRTETATATCRQPAIPCLELLLFPLVLLLGWHLFYDEFLPNEAHFAVPPSLQTPYNSVEVPFVDSV